MLVLGDIHFALSMYMYLLWAPPMHLLVFLMYWERFLRGWVIYVCPKDTWIFWLCMVTLMLG